MGSLTLVLYFCFMIPMLLSLFIMGKESKLLVSFILIGATACLIASYINSFLLDLLGGDMVYFTTTISPITEEVIKSLPILIFALIATYDRQLLSQTAFSVGLGFAILENMVILTQNISLGYTFTDVSWAVMRGIGAGLMHSVCTFMVGTGIYYVKKRKKTFYCGTVSLFMLAVTYHAIYNTLVMSAAPYKYFGIVLPILTYTPFIILYLKRTKAPDTSQRL